MADANDLILNSLFNSSRLGLSSNISQDPALNAFTNTLADNNLYKMAAGPLLSTKFDTRMWNPATTVGVTAGQAFLGSILQGLGQRWEADQINQASTLLPQIYADPASVTLPDGMSSAAFEKMRLAAAREKMIGEARKQSVIQELFGDMAKKEAEMKLNLEYQPKIEAAKETARINALTSADPTNPDLPKNKQLEKIIKEEDAARAEISKVPALAMLNARSTALSQLKEFKDLDTSTSDIPFATLFIQGLDGSVVREGEYARVQGANPFIQAYQKQLEGALNGSSRLGVDLKQRMYRELASTQKPLLELAKKQGQSRLDTAMARGVTDPSRVWPFDPNMTFEDASSSPPSISEIPAGMQLLRNKRTGETKLVPK